MLIPALLDARRSTRHDHPDVSALPRKGRPLDLSKLTLPSKLIIGAGVLLLIDSFFHWQEVSFGPISAGVSMWHGLGVLIGLLLLVILAWEAAQIAGIKINFGPLSSSMATFGLSALLVLFTLIKVISNDYVAKWAWIGLVLSVGIAVGAWLRMQAAGESLADLKTAAAAAASSAAATAKTPAESADRPSAPGPVSAPPSATPEAERHEPAAGSDEVTTSS
jgi:hypothetical protein